MTHLNFEKEVDSIQLLKELMICAQSHGFARKAQIGEKLFTQTFFSVELPMGNWMGKGSVSRFTISFNDPERQPNAMQIKAFEQVVALHQPEFKEREVDKAFVLHGKLVADLNDEQKDLLITTILRKLGMIQADGRIKLQ